MAGLVFSLRLAGWGINPRPHDYPTRDDESFMKHTIVRWLDGRPQLDWKPVTVTKWQPQERTY